MHLAQLVKRRAAAMQLITQSALALTEHPTLADKARAVASARAKDPQVDTLFKLEAVASLIFEMAYQANPAAFEPQSEPEEESDPETATAEDAFSEEETAAKDGPASSESEEDSKAPKAKRTPRSTGGKSPKRKAE